MKKWLDKIKAQAEQAMAAESVDVDYSRFNDEFSRQVDWAPLKPGGSNFGTHYLVVPESGGRTLMFKATKGGMAFGLLFFIIGVVMVGFVVWQVVTGQGFKLFWLGLFIGLPFTVVGFFWCVGSLNRGFLIWLIAIIMLVLKNPAGSSKMKSQI